MYFLLPNLKVGVIHGSLVSLVIRKVTQRKTVCLLHNQIYMNTTEKFHDFSNATSSRVLSLLKKKMGIVDWFRRIQNFIRVAETLQKYFSEKSCTVAFLKASCV